MSSDRRPLELAAKAVNSFLETEARDFICRVYMDRQFGMGIEIENEDGNEMDEHDDDSEWVESEDDEIEPSRTGTATRH